MATTKLSQPAPAREPVRTENGWTSQPWTIAGVLRTVSNGGYFVAGSYHEFAEGAQTFALNAQAVFDELRSES